MKFKERIGNTFVFDGGYDLGELELVAVDSSDFLKYKSPKGDVVYIDPHLNIKHDPMDYLYYKDIQTAVNLMQILINEGEV